jgi:hypothetical protein
MEIALIIKKNTKSLVAAKPSQTQPTFLHFHQANSLMMNRKVPNQIAPFAERLNILDSRMHFSVPDMLEYTPVATSSVAG